MGTSKPTLYNYLQRDEVSVIQDRCFLSICYGNPRLRRRESLVRIIRIIDVTRTSFWIKSRNIGIEELHGFLINRVFFTQFHKR